MTPRFSHYLDLIRFLAAFVVLLSHWAYSRFTDGYYIIIRDYNLGSDAVVLFFVLSGFVINFAAQEKDKTLKRFAFSRLTRLYTVAIPALIVTLICDLLGRHFNPAFYTDTVYYNDLSAGEFWFRGLTFSNFWLGDGIRLGTNGPFWSLSYEVAYYILFAIIIFTAGLKRILFASLALFIFGLKILLLAPAWLMGAWAYNYLKGREQVAPSGLICGAFIIIPVLLYLMMLMAGVAPLLRALTHAAIGTDNFLSLHFSDEFIWNGLIGALFTSHLIGVNLWARGQLGAPKFSRAVKWLAGGSFSLYLVHYPVLQFASGVLPKGQSVYFNHVLLLGVTFAVCYIFAACFERPLHRLRRFLRNCYAQTFLAWGSRRQKKSH